MPIEIKELIVRALVDEDPTPEGIQPELQEEGIDREALVAECVEEVLRVIRNERER